MSSLHRFSNRVENYIKYRPSYPPQVLQTLQSECALAPDHVIADIGSGTGLLSEVLLRNGNVVFGVEPNLAMRQAGEKLLFEYSNFRSINGTAENTTLPNASADFVTAGQAFHWFDHALCRTEFGRIRKADGWIVLVWNARRMDSTPFLRDYEQLLQTFGTDYAEVDHTRIDDKVLSQFFGENGFESRRFENAQTFDFAGLRGRLLSSSYAPDENDARSLPMLEELQRIFEAHQTNGIVSFDYDTNLYFGHL